MLIQNFLRQHDQDVQRMHDEFEALGNGASDDIFQTRASPLEGDLPLNVAINLEEASGVAANTSILQHRLRSLLPIKQRVRYAGIESLLLKANYRVEKTGVSHEKSGPGVIAWLISIYLSKLAIQLAAWLPYELVVVQSQDSNFHADFISSNDYWDKMSIGDFFNDDFRTCLDHVLQWMEYQEWHDSLQHLSEEVYYEFFWRFLDGGTEECAPSGMTRS
ncbi:MAG: hypothetical protein L6R35_005482 [Caloplaca aegaea]|nr:MAG: hypothetical protein L6R35_005482 [Caloplaca aegaea]